jgi:chromosomal replication initiator protein
MLWEKCLKRLLSDISDKDINVWLKPLEVIENETSLKIFATNQHIINIVTKSYLDLIRAACIEISENQNFSVSITFPVSNSIDETPPTRQLENKIPSNVDKRFCFDNFVEGRSNTMAKAFAQQVAQEPLTQLNPLFIYGSTGLGKTHLLHAIGNEILKYDSKAVVCYVHSEQFVNELIYLIRTKNMSSIEQFKKKYRSVSALLIDDIQFFAGKEASQEEFFHTFNALLQNKQRVIITSDKFPKEVNGLDPRLKSRMGWGLSVCIDPPDFETRVAILQEKAINQGIQLVDDVAYYIAKNIKSNVRELEGVLYTLIANAQFKKSEITLTFAKETLKPTVNVHNRQITINIIQKQVARYYNIRLSDLLSKKRTRSLARPRQIAMYLAKELTDKSLPEIGDEFAGRDHTTVLYAHKKIKQLINEFPEFEEDARKLINLLNE